MTRRIKQISSLAGVEIKEDTRDNDDFFFETGLEEVKSVGDFFGESFEIEPQVEGRVGDGLDLEAHAAETLDDVVALVLDFCQCCR